MNLLHPFPHTLSMNVVFTLKVVVVRCIIIVCWMVWILRSAHHPGLEPLVLTSTLFSHGRLFSACDPVVEWNLLVFVDDVPFVPAEHGLAAARAPVLVQWRWTETVANGRVWSSWCFCCIFSLSGISGTRWMTRKKKTFPSYRVATY